MSAQNQMSKYVWKKLDMSKVCAKIFNYKRIKVCTQIQDMEKKFLNHIIHVQYMVFFYHVTSLFVGTPTIPTLLISS